MDTNTLPALVRPGDDGYDDARAAWNLSADLRPAAVAVVTSVEEAQAVVAHAAEHDLTIAPQTTGHLAVALPSLERTILVKTRIAGDIEIDPEARTARVPAGKLSEDLVVAAAAHGLMCAHGSSIDVGVVGYLLGGGLSFYGRSAGVAANHVTAIEVVTADGEHRRVDADEDPDLFWALRGGGGGFGIVTAVEAQLFACTSVYAGSLFWPISDAAPVMRAWTAWQATAPESITTSFRILCLPPLPQVPEPLRATPVVCVDGVLRGDAADGAELLAPLRGAAEPMIDTWTEMSTTDALRVHGDPEQPVPGIGVSRLLGDLDEEGIAAFLATVGEGSGSPLLAAELRQLGGKLAEAPDGAGVTGSLPGSYLLFAIGVPMGGPAVAEAIVERERMLVEAMAPYATGRRFVNLDEAGGSAEPCFAPEAYARLVQTRRTWDPDRRFVSSHEVG